MAEGVEPSNRQVEYKDVNTGLEVSQTTQSSDVNTGLEVSQTTQSSDVNTGLEVSQTTQSSDVNTGLEVSQTTQSSDVNTGLEVSQATQSSDVNTGLEVSQTTQSSDVDTGLEFHHHYDDRRVANSGDIGVLVTGDNNIVTITNSSSTAAQLETRQKKIAAELDEWIAGMVKTNSFHQLLEMINQGHKWITVKGSPGEGKSTAAKMALREIQKSGRFVFEAKNPRDFEDIIKACCQPVIVLDDILGDLDFNIAEWNEWKDVFHKQLNGREHRSNDEGRVKSDGTGPTVILITRDYVLKDVARHMGRLYGFITQESRVINMSHLIDRDTEEKRMILEAVVSPYIKLSEREITKILDIDGGHGFPHVCRLFVTTKRENPSVTPQEFFTTPLKFLNETIAAFIQDEDKLCIFKEMIRNQGRVSERELEHFKLSVKLKACQLKGTYLKSEKGYYLFDHNSVYDSVSFVLGSLHTVFVIENCSMRFIKERIKLSSESDEDGMKNNENIVVTISNVYTNDLAKRFAKEIEQKFILETVLSHQACTKRNFIMAMISRVKLPWFKPLFTFWRRDSRLRSILEMTDIFGDNFLSLVASNKSRELFKYIESQPGLQLNKNDVKTVLFSVCRYGSVDLLNHLVESGYNLDLEARYEDLHETPLLLAVICGHSDVVDRLLSLGADVSACGAGGDMVLQRLCMIGHVENIEKVLDMRVDPAVEHLPHSTLPLWWACALDQIDVVKLLLSRGARVTQDVEEVAALGCRDPHIKQLITSAKITQT